MWFRLLGDPPATQRGATAITEREAIVMVTAAATMYFFCPERYWICKAVCKVVFLGWLTALAYDVRVALLKAWESVPTWLRNFAHDRDPEGSSPDQAAWTFERASYVAAKRLQEWIQKIQAGAADLWHTVYVALNQGRPRPDPKPTQWYGILIRTRPVHGYGSMTPDSWDNKQSPQPIPWQSYDTSSIPSMLLSLVADAHLSFCLVERADWDSQRVRLSEKLARGRYWDICGQDSWHIGESWTEDQVMAILGIEVLGLVDAGQNAISVCRQRE